MHAWYDGSIMMVLAICPTGETLWRAIEASPGIHLDVTRTVCVSDGKEKEVRLEDEFRDAMLKADELQRIDHASQGDA